MTDELRSAIEAVLNEAYYLRRDPSPHAPEIPWTLNEAINVLAAAYVEGLL